MPIWALPPICSEPIVGLLKWRVFETLPEGTRHFVGLNANDRTGRVSSAIREVDLKHLRGTTESGRIYELLGPSGTDPDAQFVWERWCTLNDVAQYRDVTNNLAATRSQ